MAQYLHCFRLFPCVHFSLHNTATNWLKLAEKHKDDGGANPRQRVDHTYRDFSRYLAEGRPITKHKKSDSNFPAKLHEMLSEPEMQDIITWMVRSVQITLSSLCLSRQLIPVVCTCQHPFSANCSRMVEPGIYWIKWA